MASCPDALAIFNSVQPCINLVFGSIRVLSTLVYLTPVSPVITNMLMSISHIMVGCYYELLHLWLLSALWRRKNSSL